ncbi:hypothetical protein [Nocardiopsis sp. NPDC057823]|uniref:hypothetical protein n=1 Tax=Nocardiopsis sp. NPDC057823 TaxID=3346256 RepID=UPI00366E0D54
MSTDPYLAPGARNDGPAAEPPPPPPGPAGASGGGRPPVVLGEALVIRPGDTLIIRIDPDNGTEAARQIGAEAKALLPDVDIVIIGADQLAVYRPEKVAAQPPRDGIFPGGPQLQHQPPEEATRP